MPDEDGETIGSKFLKKVCRVHAQTKIKFGCVAKGPRNANANISEEE